MKKIAFLIAFFQCAFVKAQIGGNNTFEFLNLVPSARASALGGNAIATHADDLSLIWQNPSLLQQSMDSHLQLSFADYFESIHFGQVAYAKDFNDAGMYAATLHYINYGSFSMRDAAANDIGTFSAGEYALAVSWSRVLDSLLFIGATVKGIYSDFESYSSTGVAADIGINYWSEDRFFSASVVAKNIGRQFTSYESARENLPFEIQAGITKQLPRAPFRLGISWQHVQKFNITYTDPSVPETDPLTGEENDTKITFLDKAARHLVLNVELLLSKNFNVRLGYNFQRRAELQSDGRRGLVGLSGGFGIKISKFRFDYARASYHIKGATNQISLGVRLADFKQR